MPNQTNLKTLPAPASRADAPGRVNRKHKAFHPASLPASAAKGRRRQCPPDSCTRCGAVLAAGEPAYLVHDRTVCGTCHATRQASLVAAALAAPRLPARDEDSVARRPWWGRALVGTCALACFPVTLLGGLSRKNRRRRQQAALTPLLDHLHRVANRA